MNRPFSFAPVTAALLFVLTLAAGCLLVARYGAHTPPRPGGGEVKTLTVSRDADGHSVRWESRGAASVTITGAPDICADDPGTLYYLDDPEPVTLSRLLSAVYPHQRFVFVDPRLGRLPVRGRLVDISRARLAQAALTSNDLAFACTTSNSPTGKVSRLAPPPSTTDPFDRRAVLVTTKNDMRAHAADYARSWDLPSDVLIPAIARELKELNQMLDQRHHTQRPPK